MIGIFKKSRIPLSYAKFRSRNNCVSLKFRPEFLVLSFEINKAEFLLVFFDFCQNTFIFFFNFQSLCCGYGIDGHGMIFFSVHLPLSFRDAPRVKNPRGPVVMRRAAAARRRLLIYQNLGGLRTSRHTRLLHAYKRLVLILNIWKSEKKCLTNLQTFQIRRII